MKAEGTLQTTFYTLIPFFLYYSKSRITNGRDVNKASNPQASRVCGCGQSFSV
jgi:hypothetical protein